MRKAYRLILLLMLLAVVAAAQNHTKGLAIEGLDGRQTTFTLQQMQKLPRQSVTVADPHTHANHIFEGVLLSALLIESGAPSGKSLEGASLHDYLEVIGTDHYKVVFSLPEVDPMFSDNKVLVADIMDGKPLDSSRGFLQLIAPQDRRAARWVRMLTSIRVLQAQ